MPYVHPHESQEMRLREKIRRLAEKQPEVADVLDALVDFQKMVAPVTFTSGYIQPANTSTSHVGAPTITSNSNPWTPTHQRSLTFDASGNIIDANPPQDKQS